MDYKKESVRQFAEDIRLIYMELHNAGFPYDEAFELTKAYTNSAGHSYRQMIFNDLTRRSSNKPFSDMNCKWYEKGEPSLSKREWEENNG